MRTYNEDRVSIVLQLKKPENKKNCEKWPNCQYFAIFDGHAGHMCADFLRDNLHNFIARDQAFPDNPRQALLNAFKKAD